MKNKIILIATILFSSSVFGGLTEGEIKIHGSDEAYNLFKEAKALEKEGDYENAVKKYKKSAKKGNSWAQHRLGQMYFGGRGGVEKDTKKALYWYEKSAKRGNKMAQEELQMLKIFGLK